MAERIYQKVISFLSSFAFAVILLLFLLLLTYLGTLEQTTRGLFEVQERYFESLFLVHWLFGKVPVPLPGVYLLLVLLSINLVLGGIVRMKRSWTRVGIYVTHVGILALIFSAFVSHQKSIHGHMTLFEGEESGEFLSHFDWELAIYPAGKAGPVEEFLIPQGDLDDLEPGAVRTFTSKDLPFDLTVWNWLPNCVPTPVPPGHDHGQAVFGSFVLTPLEPEKEAEGNRAGAYVAVKWKGTDRLDQGILWGEPMPPFGRQMYPYLAVSGQDRLAIDLRKVRKNLPFRIHLNDFHHEFHPGTDKPKVFRSEVTKTEMRGGEKTEQVVRIVMNEPLRSQGYTVYQSNWGPTGAPAGASLFSGFSVVWNPADQWPLYCTIVIALGLLIHFGRKLYLYLKAEARRRA